MAITNNVDDYQQLNPADDQTEWTGGTLGDTVNFDAPQLNNTASTTPIYIEAASCLFWPLKQGQTGYTYTNQLPATVDITGKIVVGWLNYPLADIANIPITAIGLRISSNTAFTTNHIEWNALAQISAPENVPISGHVPIMGYESGGTVTGTPSKTAMQSVGWTATTGATADGKQGGFDHFFAISYVGAHSQTFTNTFLSDLYDEWYDNNGGGLPGTADRPLGVLSESGTFYQTNVRFALGAGTGDTANIDVTESNKTIFFNNLETDHELGWLLNNPASTNECRLTLTNVTQFWNDQDSTTSIYDGVANADIFRIDGCSHANGGKTILAAHISDANTYMKNCSWNGCQRIEPSTMLVEDYVVNDTADTAVDSGAIELDSTSHRLGAGTITKGTAASHAIVITTAGTYSLDDINFVGYNVANGNADSTIRNESGGAVTINASGVSGNLTYQNGAGSTTTINQTVNVTVTVIDANTGSPIEDASVILGTTAGGTDVIDNLRTNASGVVSVSYAGSTPQAVQGFAAKGTIAPVYARQPISGTIGANGLSVTVPMAPD